MSEFLFAEPSGLRALTVRHVFNLVAFMERDGEVESVVELLILVVKNKSRKKEVLRIGRRNSVHLRECSFAEADSTSEQYFRGDHLRDIFRDPFPNDSNEPLLYIGCPRLFSHDGTPEEVCPIKCGNLRMVSPNKTQLKSDTWSPFTAYDLRISGAGTYVAAFEVTIAGQAAETQRECMRAGSYSPLGPSSVLFAIETYDLIKESLSWWKALFQIFKNETTRLIPEFTDFIFAKPALVPSCMELEATTLSADNWPLDFEPKDSRRKLVRGWFRVKGPDEIALSIRRHQRRSHRPTLPTYISE